MHYRNALMNDFHTRTRCTSENGSSIRLATAVDIPAIAAIYGAIHDREARGEVVIGWQRDIYPTADTAREAVLAREMYVLEDSAGRVAASARINRRQMPAYAQVDWRYPADDDRVLVLHTLTVDPACGRRGYARQFIAFYEALAARLGCTALRIDTNAKNAVARATYARLGYIESGVIPCEFNGIPGVRLVCLEKTVGSERC